MNNLKKKSNVVMLSTEKAGFPSIVLNPSTNKLSLPKGYSSIEYQDIGYKTYHLYFTSNDEKPKVGDYCYDKILNIVFQTDKYTDFEYINQTDNVKKIISTTDTSLKIESEYKIRSGRNVEIYPIERILPQPSPQFVSKFIEEYNRKNIITEVMVDYVDNGEEDWIGDDYNGEPFWNEKIELKVDSNNHITITKCKPTLLELCREDNDLREEVIQLIKSLKNIPIIVENQLSGKRISSRNWEFDNTDNWFDKWIEKNLK